MAKMIQLVIEEFYDVEKCSYDKHILGGFQTPRKAKQAIEIAKSRQMWNMDLKDLGEDFLGYPVIGDDKVRVTYKRQWVDIYTDIEKFREGHG